MSNSDLRQEMSEPHILFPLKSVNAYHYLSIAELAFERGSCSPRPRRGERSELLLCDTSVCCSYFTTPLLHGWEATCTEASLHRAISYLMAYYFITSQRKRDASYLTVKRSLEENFSGSWANNKAWKGHHDSSLSFLKKKINTVFLHNYWLKWNKLWFTWPMFAGVGSVVRLILNLVNRSCRVDICQPEMKLPSSSETDLRFSFCSFTPHVCHTKWVCEHGSVWHLLYIQAAAWWLICRCLDWSLDSAAFTYISLGRIKTNRAKIEFWKCCQAVKGDIKLFHLILSLFSLEKRNLDEEI